MKQVLVSAAIAVPLLAGGWLAFSGGNGNGDSQKEPTEEAPRALGGLELEEENERLARELERTRDEAARLRAKIGRLDAEARAAESVAEEAVAEAPKVAEKEAPSGSGIDWSNLSRLVTENADLLAKVVADEGNVRPTPAEQAKLMQIMSELMKLSGEAKKHAAQPLLDPVILSELTGALFGETLGLSDEQKTALEAAHHSILGELIGDTDPAELIPLDRYRARRDVSQALNAEFEGMLSDEQLERWKGLEPFTRGLFSGASNVHEYGVDIKNLDGQIVENWQESFHLREDQLERARALATSYVEEGRTRLGMLEGEPTSLGQLTPEARRALEDEFFEMQRRYESSVEQLLDEGQLEKYLKGVPRVIRFQFGRGAGSSNQSGVF